MGKGIAARFGMGKGKVVSLDSPDAIGELVEWAARAGAGDRLLMTASTHKEIKKRTKCVNGMALEYGLKLQWRYGREVKLVDKYVHPEHYLVRDTTYQAWVLVRARAVLEPVPAEKKQWLFESVLGQLNKADQENGAVPSWVYDMGPEELETTL